MITKFKTARALPNTALADSTGMCPRVSPAWSRIPVRGGGKGPHAQEGSAGSPPGGERS